MKTSPPLADLLSALQAEGFPVGVDDHLRVARVIALDGDWTIDKLRRALRGIFATDLATRALFDQVFDRFFAGRASVLDRAPEVAEPAAVHGDAPAPVERDTPAAADPPTSSRRPKLLLVALLLAVGIAVAVYAVRRRTSPGTEVAEATPADARVAAPPTRPNDARVGPAKPGVDRPVDPASDARPAEWNDPRAPKDREPGDKGPGPENSDRGSDDPDLSRDPMDPSAPVASTDTDPGAKNTHAPDAVGPGRDAGVMGATRPGKLSSGEPHRDLGAILIGALLIGGLVALFAGLRSRRRLRLRRRAFVPGPWRYRRRIPTDQLGRAFAVTRIEDGAAHLTWQTRKEGAAVLDIDRTVARTVAAAGFPRPVYRPPPPAPEYAVLIDAAPSTSPWRPLYEELFQRLQSRGVRMRRYSYHGSPDVCTPQAGGRDESLAELAEHHDALIVVGDAGLGCDPFDRHTPGWAETLTHFPHRLWLNPLPPSRWSEGARAIAMTTPMVHGTTAGLAALRPGAASPRDGDRAFPAVIELAPDSELATSALRQHLGPAGFRCLCLCAVVGHPDPDTARWLAHRFDLKPGEDALLRLLSLEFFATGKWPPGLASRLVAALRGEWPDDESRARRLVLGLLAASEPEPDSVAHLRWRLDRVLQERQLGELRSSDDDGRRPDTTRGDDDDGDDMDDLEIAALCSSPIHGEAVREFAGIGIRDRVGHAARAMSVVGALALVMGAAGVGQRLLDRTGERRAAAERRRQMIDEWGARWRAAKTCFFASETPLEKTEEALAFRLAVEPADRIDWLSCTATLERLVADVRGDEWIALRDSVAELGEFVEVGLPAVLTMERAGEALMFLDAAVDQLAAAIGDIDAEYAALRASMDMDPLPGVDTRTLADAPRGTVIVDSAGRVLVPGEIEMSIDGIVVRGRTERGLALAALRGPDAIEVHPVAEGVVRAMAGADWGMDRDPSGRLQVGKLDGSGKLDSPTLVAGRSQGDKYASSRGSAVPGRKRAKTRKGAPESKLETTKRKKVQRVSKSVGPPSKKESTSLSLDGPGLQGATARQLLPRFALGRGDARLVVAEDADNGVPVLATSRDRGRSWQSVYSRPSGLAAWRPDWLAGRLLAVETTAESLRWFVYSEPDPAALDPPGRYSGTSVRELRAACLGREMLWAIGAEAALGVKVADGGDAHTVDMPASDEILVACTDRQFFTLSGTDGIRFEARLCSTGSCDAPTAMPRRPGRDLAVGVFAGFGPMIAHVSRGILILWSKRPGETGLFPRPVFRVERDTRAAALAVWDGRLHVLLDATDRAVLVRVPGDLPRIPALPAAEPKTDPSPEDTQAPEPTDDDAAATPPRKYRTGQKKRSKKRRDKSAVPEAEDAPPLKGDGPTPTPNQDGPNDDGPDDDGPDDDGPDDDEPDDDSSADDGPPLPTPDESAK